MRGPGGLIRATPMLPSRLAAPGIWKLKDAIHYRALGMWPIPPPIASLTFNGSNQYLSRTFGGGGNQDAWTFHAWLKKTSSAGGTLFSMGNFGAANSFQIVHRSDGALEIINFSSGAVVFSHRITTSTTLVPLNTWIPITVVYDSLNGTANDRVRLYVGLSQITVFSSAVNPSSGTDSYANSAAAHNVGRALSSGNGANHFTGHMAGVTFVDGQALDASDFLHPNGKPKKFDGALGTNGFILGFADPASTTTLGLDDGTGAPGSGAGSNDWTLNNMTTANFSTDVPFP